MRKKLLSLLLLLLLLIHKLPNHLPFTALQPHWFNVQLGTITDYLCPVCNMELNIKNNGATDVWVSGGWRNIKHSNYVNMYMIQMQIEHQFCAFLCKNKKSGNEWEKAPLA